MGGVLRVVGWAEERCFPLVSGTQRIVGGQRVR